MQLKVLRSRSDHTDVVAYSSKTYDTNALILDVTKSTWSRLDRTCCALLYACYPLFRRNHVDLVASTTNAFASVIVGYSIVVWDQTYHFVSIQKVR